MDGNTSEARRAERRHLSVGPASSARAGKYHGHDVIIIVSTCVRKIPRYLRDTRMRITADCRVRRTSRRCEKYEYRRDIIVRGVRCTAVRSIGSCPSRERLQTGCPHATSVGTRRVSTYTMIIILPTCVCASTPHGASGTVPPGASGIRFSGWVTIISKPLMVTTPRTYRRRIYLSPRGNYYYKKNSIEFIALQERTLKTSGLQLFGGEHSLLLLG